MSYEDAIDGVLFRAESVSGDGEKLGLAEVVLTLEEGTIDVRLGDKKSTIWMLPLAKVEDALRQLKRIDAARMREDNA